MEDINRAFINPDEPDVKYAELDFDAQINLTQTVKHRVLHKLVSDIGGLPTDKDSVELILKVADSLDKTTIAKKRAVTEEKSSNDALSILNAIAQTISTGKGINPFVKDDGSISRGGEGIGELPDYDGKHANGEGVIGVIIESSEDFTQRMDIVNKQVMADREAAMGLTQDNVPTKTP